MRIHINTDMSHLGYERPERTACHSQFAAEDKQRVQDDVEQVAGQCCIQGRPRVSQPSEHPLHATSAVK